MSALECAEYSSPFLLRPPRSHADIHILDFPSWLRSWMWEGQTVMSLTEGDSGASRAEIDEMLRVWKEDMMNVVATATE